MIRDLPDKRCIGMKDVPYSAYCRVCWFPTFLAWNPARDGEHGLCMHGHTVAAHCPEACNRARGSAEIQKLRDAGLWPGSAPVPAVEDRPAVPPPQENLS